MIRCVLSVLLVAGLASCSKEEPKPDPKDVLVFSLTKGYRHDSIPAGISALEALGKEQNFNIVATEDPAQFSFDNLKKFDAIVFLNTTGDVLNDEQQLEMESYIQAGGGFVGIHAAADTEWQEGNWYWYQRLVGGIFTSHPSNPSNVQNATLKVESQHASTQGIPAEFEFADEWYDFRFLNPTRTDVLSVDESTYQEGQHSGYHPIAWYHDFDGGRSFYTNLGHKAETFSDPTFLKHIAGGLTYAMGEGKPTNLAGIRPAMGDFKKVVLTTELNEPMSLDFFSNGDVLIAERPGSLKLYKPSTEEKIDLGSVNTDMLQSHFEMGLQGVAIDETDERTFVYASYTQLDADDNMNMRLARFPWRDGAIQYDEEVVFFDYGVDKNCCHMGGDIELTQDGLLFLSTGDNTNPHDQEGYSPIDFRDEVKNDALRSAGNTQDLRGKILRIRPLEDGTYEIPEGNLFTDATQGRPEIYVMGGRNPFTITYDDRSGDLFYGDVGPDANEDSPEKGTRGYDEFNRVAQAGNFGWPLFRGNSFPYINYDYVDSKSLGDSFDPAAPVNNSPRNTGIANLPPAQGPLMWYPYENSKEFPELGAGGRTAIVADVYHSEDYPEETRYPSYYDKRLFIIEFMRRWVKAVEYDSQNRVHKIEDFAPQWDFTLPIDGRFGPDGRLYILEYGSAWFKENPDAILVRIDYDEGRGERMVAKLQQEAAPEGHQQAPAEHPGEKYVKDNACLSCHKVGGVSIGPDFIKVAEKYAEQDDAVNYISGRIANGSAGVWGANAMPPFTHLDENTRKAIAEYIMSLNE